MTLLKRIGTTLSAVLLSLMFVVGFSPVVHAESESIDKFSSDIVVETNGTVSVTETILYNFGSNQKHGIFRDLPLTVKNGPQLAVGVQSVQDENQQPYAFTTSTTNNVLHIKIGDPNFFVTGKKTYEIRYLVQNAIRTFPDHDELYWNVTGNDWIIPILFTTSSVTMQSTVPVTMNMACYTGLSGSTEKNCQFSQVGNMAKYYPTKPLAPNEGLSIVWGVPLGVLTPIVQETAQQPNPIQDIIDRSGLHIILLVFCLMIVFISKFNRKRASKYKSKPVIPKELKNQPVITQYNPPDDLSPIEVGTILDRRVDMTDISSVIIDLAVRGYLKIQYTILVIKFWPDKKDFTLLKLKDGTDLVHPADKIIFELFFTGRDTVSLSQLQLEKTTFQMDIKKIKDDTEKHLTEDGYLDAASKKNAGKIFIILFLFAFVFPFAFSLIRIVFGMWSIVISILFFGITMIFWSKYVGLSQKLTSKGISALANILGFQEFLRMTETDKLRLTNVPALQPETFEKFLPYAMVLGVEAQWAKTFEGIYTTAPGWYEDPTMTQWNSYVMIHNMSLFNGSFNQVFQITTPRSSSGFGGGFSGGGSGGGGGGSW